MTAAPVSLRTRAAVMQMAMENGEARLRMKGGSMHPDLREGDILQIGPAGRLRVGDVAVFVAGRRLVAHRIVGFEGERVMCSGDAQPDLVEYVERGSIAGKVIAVIDERGRRADTLAALLRGHLRARLHPWRAMLKIALPHTRPRTYQALSRAMSAILCGNDEELARALHAETPLRMARLARAHRCAAALCAAAARLRDDEYAERLRQILSADGWSARARRVPFAAQVREVAAHLRSHGIEPVLLKGAHRAMMPASDASFFDSVDIDVLVPKEQVDRACEALAAAGYVQHDNGAKAFYREHHHAAPMYRAGALPVEIHHALERSAVCVPNTLPQLKPFLTRIQSEGEEYSVLDNAGTALHLALHCLHRPPLRDLLLLAAQMRRLDDFDRVRLCGMLQREGRNAVALNAAVFAAAQLAGVSWEADLRARRYAAWMLMRDDLPRPLRRRTACIDAWYCASEHRALHALRAAFSDPAGSLGARVLRAFAWVACAALTACYAPLMRR